MTLEVDFQNEGQNVPDDMIQMLEALLQHSAKKLEVTNAELSVVFVDNDRIQEINATYRDKNQPTDVISFAMEEEGDGETPIIGGEELPRILGDIIISVPKAQEQADEHGHSIMREMGFLTVHGFLHLLGYDHMIKSDEIKMFRLQDELLDSYGLSRFS